MLLMLTHFDIGLFLGKDLQFLQNVLFVWVFTVLELFTNQWKTLQSIYTVGFLKFLFWTIQFVIGIPCLVILTNILTRCLTLR
jgi:hypothetical protein